ncbi:hypothetical protein A4X13_0g8804 [Tilletia indica]|uniref:Uncharacterized protein n=1 Tax=Tilletia indica TaxID=43049 RepID=A0A177T059_9BASI|nr:hypothetical protein A4X13_0g8804 [Tilletia indica]
MTTYTLTLRPHPDTLYLFNPKTFTFKAGDYHIIHLGGDDFGRCPSTTSNEQFPAPLPAFLSELTFFKSDFWFRDVAPKADEHGSMLNNNPIRQLRDEDSAVVFGDGDKLELGRFATPVGSRSSQDFLSRIVCTVELTQHSAGHAVFASSISPSDRALEASRNNVMDEVHPTAEPVRDDVGATTRRDPTSVSTSVLSSESRGSSSTPTTSDRPTSSSMLSANSTPSVPSSTCWRGVQALVHELRTSTAVEKTVTRQTPSPSIPVSVPAFVYSRFVDTSNASQHKHHAQTTSMPQEDKVTDDKLRPGSVVAKPPSPTPTLAVRSSSSASTASAALAIRRARAAWIVARAEVLASSSPIPVIRSPTLLPARTASIDLALDRFRSAWLSIRSQMPPIVSGLTSLETPQTCFALASAPAADVYANHLQDPLPRDVHQAANSIPQSSFPKPVLDTTSYTRASPSSPSSLSSYATPSPPPVSSMTPAAVSDSSITSIWPALFVQFTALFCILALR